MGSKLVASVDGVLLKVGNTAVSLYQGGAVPDGADKDHVKLLSDRGLLVQADEDADVDEPDTKADSKSASKSA